MKTEIYFLRYAYPCAFVIRQRKEIDDSLMERLRRAAINDERIEKTLLEKIFFRAFKRIKEVANELSKDYWDKEVIREYFVNRHNMLIEDSFEAYSEVPHSMKELCKVYKAKIVDKKESMLIVEYGAGKRRPVHPDFVPDAKISDVVTIHYGYAVEKVE